MNFRVVCVFVILAAVCAMATGNTSEFEPPVMLKAGDAAVRVDEPGYAAPCWADIDGDGLKDLLVGQFANGWIRVYKNLGDAKLAPGTLLEADGEVAAVPGVW